jgi:lipopolysaccharide biosynthesis glycosyltransferase
MLINIQEWRTGKITDILLDFIKNNPDKIVVADQSALNICIPKKKVFLLPPIYNQTIQFRLSPI